MAKKIPKPDPEEPDPGWLQAKKKRYAVLTVDDVLVKAQTCDSMSAALRNIAAQLKKSGTRQMTVEGGFKLDRGLDLIDKFIRNVEVAMVRARDPIR